MQPTVPTQPRFLDQVAVIGQCLSDQVATSIFYCLEISSSGCLALRGIGKTTRTLASERP
jgi:hypothetical protein